MQPIRFDPDQCAALSRLGLVDEAINQIEVDALPAAQAILRRGPPRGEVTDELRAVAKAIHEARSAIERLLNATDAAPHRLAARSQIAGGGRRHAMGGLRLDQTSKSLASALEVVSVAISRLPPGPSRHQAANPYPIELIHNAVQLGFILAGHEPLFPKLKPSRSPTSAFRLMVGICYEAIDAPSVDPERALRAYVTDWRKLARDVENMERGTERPPKT